MFTMLRTETSTLEDLFDAWVFAAHDAEVAWHAWRTSPAPFRADAFASYRAGLDREEHAAAVLAAALRRPTRL
jgi:hypothetical protein